MAGDTIYIPIGAACPCAYMLRVAGLRTCSMPFDWIIPLPEQVMDMMHNDFADYLDKAQYTHEAEPCTDALKPNGCAHTKYSDTFFRHHCPVCFEAHYAYLERCVQRFRVALANPDIHKVFVFMNIWVAEEEAAVIRQVDTIVKNDMFDCLKLHSKGRASLLIVEAFAGSDKRNTQMIEEYADLKRIRVWGHSINAGVKYQDPDDQAQIASIFGSTSNVATNPEELDETKNQLWPYALWDAATTTQASNEST